MSTDSTPEQKNRKRKLKVKFVGHFRDQLQCRGTKVNVTARPGQVKESIKYHLDKARDLENILEVVEQVDLKNERPCIGELLMGCDPSNPPIEWSKVSEKNREYYQKWAENFIYYLQRERYMTELLRYGDAYDHDRASHKRDTVQAIREILERR